MDPSCCRSCHLVSWLLRVEANHSVKGDHREVGGMLSVMFCGHFWVRSVVHEISVFARGARDGARDGAREWR